MGRKGGKKKKKQQNAKKGAAIHAEPEDLVNAPHSFVFFRGAVGDIVSDLTRDFRKIMEPFTASSLKARKANSVRDFLSVAGVLHVSHMVVFSTTDAGTYMKVARVPRGPTVYFKVINYCLSRDVISSLKKQCVFPKQFEHPPLVVLNNFNANVVQHQLTASIIQNMFPAINLTKINLNNVRRCVLFNYNVEKDEIDVRHYAVRVIPVGLSKGVKKIVQSKVPDLSRFDDISEFITKSEVLSESEGEDDPNSHVTLPQKIASRGNEPLAQSSIRLVEQGPRLTLQLMKIEDGFLSGDVLHHRFIQKTEEEKAQTVKRRVEKRQLKEERKRIQAERVKLKEKAKEDNIKKSWAGMKKKEEEDKLESEDDDADWYKKEVGQEPEHDLFKKKQGLKRKPSFEASFKSKRRKLDDQNSKRKKGDTKAEERSFKGNRKIQVKPFKGSKKGLKQASSKKSRNKSKQR